jgi:para-nitrobenzyl esterase
LNLDVYSRFIGSTTAVPTIAWIFGGSLIYGDSTVYQNLNSLAIAGNIVLVSINYRLNAHGFLALPALSRKDPSGVSGNYGFEDQQLGLDWIQRNIHNFGGDPSRVTLMGQSSGATSIFMHLMSRRSNGLFQGRKEAVQQFPMV